MDLGIAGKRALVTGGSSGIGRACAVELAREGARVCFVGRDEERLGETRRLTAEAGSEGIAVRADLATEAGCRAAVEACVAALGGIDILVNVAGAAQASPVLEMPVSALQTAFDLKLYGFLRMSQLAIPYMQQEQWGRIVMVAGAAATSPEVTNLPSSLNNIAILNLTRSLTDAVASDGILVNAVCPGATNTPRAQARYGAIAQRQGRRTEEVIAEVGRALPAGRFAEADEVARVVTFLASEACSYVQASAIYMDGGARRATP